jgi:hypothetical protein
MAADLANLKIRVDALEAQNATRELGKLEQAGAKAEKGLGGMMGSLRGLAGLLGVAAVAKAATDAVTLASRYETLGVVMGVLGNNAGYSRAQMDEFQKSLQATGISMIASREALNMMASAQLNLVGASDLARAAQNAAVIAGINSSEAFTRLVRGIQSGETEILKTMGILVDFEAGYKRLAPEIGKTADTLTQHEKALIRQKIVMEDATKKAGAYDASMGTAGKQMLSMQRYIDDLKVKFGTLFQPALRALVFDLAQGIKNISAGLETWASQNEGSVREFVDSLTIAVRSAGQLAKDVGAIGVAIGQTGVETGALARTLQGIALLIFGIDATARAVAGTFAQFSAWMMKNFTTPFLEAENSLRRMAKIAQVDLLFNMGASGVRKLDAAATGLDMFGSQQGDTVAARWEAIMQDIEGAGTVAKIQATTDEIKKQTVAVGGLSAEGKKHAQQLATIVERYKEEREYLGVNADLVERMKAAKLGASDATLKFIATVQQEKNAFDAENESIKKQIELREEMWKAAFAAIEMVPEKTQDPMGARLREDAQNLGLDTETPEERTARGLQHLQQMLQTGAIPSLEAYRRRWIELQLQAGGSLEHIGIVMQTVTDRMGQAFANFVTTGKASFKDLVSSILSELARLYAQKAFAQLLEFGIGAFFGTKAVTVAGIGDTIPMGGGTGISYTGPQTVGLAPGGGTAAAMFNPGGGGESGPVNTSIVVNVGGGGEVSGQANGEGQRGVALARLIEGKIRQTLVDEMRPNGLLNPGGA